MNTATRRASSSLLVMLMVSMEESLMTLVKSLKYSTRMEKNFKIALSIKSLVMRRVSLSSNKMPNINLRMEMKSFSVL